MNPAISLGLGILLITISNVLNKTFNWMPEENLLPYQLWIMAICIFLTILPTKVGSNYGI
tara:strand:+ start:2099 stop:2278 length:180 start_codon:yes stop_codon:yes gene_type:complete